MRIEKRRLLLTTAAFIACSISAPVFAQDAAEADIEAQEASAPIVVTGSRIARPETEGAAPLIASIDAETIEQRSFSNVVDVLNEIPGFGVSVSSNGGQAGFSVGQNFVNLFGIGSQRTLTLVNGRRFVSSNTASNFGGANSGLQVDLNVIPVSLIKNVDVLTVRGATTYGSDAVAGTVNIVLKDNFEGFETFGQYGLYEEGDGEQVRFGATIGGNFADDRGNLTVNFEYTDSNGILSTERERTAASLSFQPPPASANSPFGVILIENRRLPVLSRGGVPSRGGTGAAARSTLTGAFFNAAGTPVQFGSNGELIPLNIGGGTGSSTNVSGGDGLNLAETSQISSDLERLTVFATGHYDLTDNVRFFFEANYAETSAVELANQPVFQSSLFGGNSGSLGVLLSNPFLTAQARSTLLLPGNLANANGQQVFNFDVDGDGVNDDTRFFLQRASLDLLEGRNANFGELELFRAVSGIQGDLELGGRDFNYNVSYSYGRSQQISTSTSLVQENFINAIDAVVDPTTGNIVCRSSLDPANIAISDAIAFSSVGVPRATAGCVPLNLFGEGVASQAAIDYVTTIVTSEAINTQKIFNANFGGSPFDVFGNPVYFNIGYETRRESQSFTPDGFLQQGLGRSVPIAPVRGGYKTDEFFGEVLIPLISPENDSFIHSFEIDGSFRYIDNSLAGTAEVWSVGAVISPIADITFRGSYTESVRAPAITELFLPEVRVFAFADDPCDTRNIGEGPNPQRRAANCAADGITQPFTSIIQDASQQISTAGNPNLLNERSKSWTIGAVFQPSFIPNFSLAVDWVDIDLKDAIVDLELEQILNSCYDSDSFPNAPVCGQFTRDPTTHQIADALQGSVNAGSFKFAGLQATARYNFDLARVFGGNPGELGIVARYFYQDKSQQTVAGVVDDFNGEIGDFRHEANTTVTYKKGGTTVSLTGIYFSSAKFDNDNTPTSQDFLGVGDYIQFNTTFRQEINDKFSLRFTIDNLFEEEAPYPSSATNTYNAGILGRRYTIGLTGKF